MSCSATKMRSQEKTASGTSTWGQVFPAEQLTAQKSTLFVKKLLAIAVSNITYLRMIFPEHAFGDRCLEDLNLKILRDHSSCPGARQVIKWVKGCFDALDKKYLKMLMIGMCTNADDPDTVIESYTFKFSYAEDGGIDIYRNNKKLTSASSAAETKEATMRLLRTIVILTQSLQSLPDNIMMTMKLLYYDEVTPAEYEPPGFQAASTDNFNFALDGEPMNIKVGDVATPFHTVKLQIKTDGKQFELQPDGIPGASEDMVTTGGVGGGEGGVGGGGVEAREKVCDGGLDGEDEDELMDLAEQVPEMVEGQIASSMGEMQVVPEPCEADSAPGLTPSKPGFDDQAVVVMNETSSQISNMEDSGNHEEFGIRCGCGCNEDDGLMILCAVCELWQHAVCFAILREEDAPERHICHICANLDDPNLLPTEGHLCSLETVALQATCLWRRALLACSEMSRILPPNLARRLGVDMTVAQGLINRLEKEHYVKAASKGKRLGKTVDKAKLNEGIKKYFEKKNEKKDALIEDGLKKKTAPSKDDTNEVDHLTAKAGELAISGGKTSRKPGHKPQVAVNVGSKASPCSRTRQRKRIRSRADDSQQFDMCNSQDLSQDNEPTRKRRKSSLGQYSVIVSKR